MASKTDDWHTCIWKIKNFSYCWQKRGDCLTSPWFSCGTQTYPQLRLGIFPYGRHCSDYIACFITDGFQDTGYEYKLAILDLSGSCLAEWRSSSNRRFQGNEIQGSDTLALQNEIFIKKKMSFLPNDTLTVRCSIYNPTDKSYICKRLVRTRIGVQRQTATTEIKNFSCLNSNCIHSFQIPSYESEIPTMLIKFALSEGCCHDENLTIDIILDKNEQRKFSTCNVFILDAAGNKSKCGKSSIWFDPNKTDQEWKFSLIFTKWELVEKKDLYLPNDILSLQIECSSSMGILKELTEIHQSSTLIPTDDTVSSSDSVKEDLGNLFKENILCDVNLQTKTQTFPAHKAILSARSPVFKAMFTNDFKEQQNGRVDIDDLDDETVRRLLLYIYTNTVENLQWQTACQLYEAADKYSIGLLKKKCSLLLKRNLYLSNLCETIALADKHQDEYLKNFVYDYILQMDNVIESEEWKELEQKNPLLTSETMRHVYLKAKDF